MSESSLSRRSAAFNRFLNRRGVVSGWWTAAPVGVALVTAATISLVIMNTQRPAFLPYMAAFYGCIFFFAHAYSVAWRAGTYFWQYLAMLVTVSLLGVAGWLHMDDASARVVYENGSPIPRSPEPILFLAVVMDGLAAFMLILHCTVIGFGKRPPRIGPGGAEDQAHVEAGTEDEQPEAQPKGEDLLPFDLED